MLTAVFGVGTLVSDFSGASAGEGVVGKVSIVRRGTTNVNGITGARGICYIIAYNIIIIII